MGAAVREDRVYRRLRAEELQRYRWRDQIRAELFDRQLGLYDATASLKAGHPGRRSGKSEFIPRAAPLDAIKAGFDEVIIIGAETQKKARALHWRKLDRLVRKHRLPFTPDKQAGTWTTPWGAAIVFWGIKDEGAVELLRGYKLFSAYFDEVATYSEHLEYLAQSVVGPALQDTGGTLYFLGTPSKTRAGPWFRICNSETKGWTVFHWTMLQNKRFPRDAETVLREVREQNGWTEDHPTYQREYLGLFVNDPSSLVYQFNEARNSIAAMPAYFLNRLGEIDHLSWLFSIGVDFGTTKPCGWVVWGWHRHERRIYALHAEKHAGLLVDDAAKITARLCRTYRPVALVGDVGGLGKPYAEEWNQRYAGRNEQLERAGKSEYALPSMAAADKLGKLGHIRLLNNELGSDPPRAVLLPSAKPYADEMATLPYYDPDAPDELLKEHPGHENHCADAGLYAYIETRTFFNEPPDPELASRSDPDEAQKWAEKREAAELQRQSRMADWERF